ncbi:MAG: hypothetical protein HND52_13430 [Ignavibacteriae bacterium]|nr:hypothetical protein [Ignavibacteriota bacterium]NOG98955.1 hypothetical protein [Ignavibacteriota bacterium]
MKKRLLSFLLLLIICACSSGDNTPVESNEDVKINVYNANYTLETIHGSFFGELNDYHYRSFSILVKLDQPAFYKNIKKLIIYDDVNKIGWEFSDEELHSKYAADLEGFHLEHLIVSSYNTGEGICKITLYDYKNEIIDIYDFILKNNHPPYSRFEYNWYDTDKLLIETDFSHSFPDTINVIYLNENEIVQKSTYLPITNTIIADSLPNNFNSFFLECKFENELYRGISISPRKFIENRVPINAVFLPEGISVDKSIFSASRDRLILLSSQNSKVYFWDHNSNTITSEFLIQSSPTACKQKDGNLFISTENGSIYKLDENDNLTFLSKLSGKITDFVIAEDYLVSSISNNDFWVYNLISDTAMKVTGYYSGAMYGMVYNTSLKVIYACDRSTQSNNEIFRMNFDPVSGEISQFRRKYFSSSSGDAGFPLRIFPSQNKLITGSGLVLSLSDSYSNDLTYITNTSEYFTDMLFSPTGKMVIVYSNYSPYYQSSANTAQLKILNPNNFETEKTYDLFETPISIFSVNQDYLVLSKISTSERYFLQKINKQELVKGSFGKFINKYYKPNF